MTPTTASPSPASISSITMQLRGVMALSGKPNRSARSTTGTTRPRRLITPRTAGGIAGTRVRLSYSMISFTRRMSTAYSSPTSTKLRNCVRSTLAVLVIGVLEAREVRVIRADGGGFVLAVGLRPALNRRRNRGPLGCDRRRLGSRGPGKRLLRAGDLEERHQLLERLGLRGHLLGGGRQLFGGRC